VTTRVLMTADTVGGVWTYALDLVDALAPFGIEVHLATMGRRMTRDQRMAARSSAVVDVIESDYALEWMADPWHDVDRAGEWLLDLEDHLRPDVVHLNGYAHGVLPWRAPTICVAHSDVLSWWHAVHGVAAPAADWHEYRRRVGAGVEAAGELVAPTGAVADDMRRWYGRRPRVIHNGRADTWLRHDVRAEPVILGAGRVWDEAKNLAALDRVAPRLPWPVVIAGEGDGDGGVAGRFLGRVPFEELAEWLAVASLFVAPARYEPFGLGPLEAAMAGCALVLGDIPSLREVWDDAAVFVDPDDDDALVAAIRSLVDDQARRDVFTSKALDRASLFRSSRMAAAYADVYGRLTAKAVAS
jgi:glycogen synthase